jgi:CheY-like chemotaxis protein
MQKRILIIENADDVRDGVQAALESGTDYEVLTAKVGRQGVYLAERRQPDAILVATEMPDIDGARIVRELRANPSTRDIPVIFLRSADATTGEADVVGAIDKPLDMTRLVEDVQRLLGW